jgi:hypothetical protein
MHWKIFSDDFMKNQGLNQFFTLIDELFKNCSVEIMLLRKLKEGPGIG